MEKHGWSVLSVFACLIVLSAGRELKLAKYTTKNVPVYNHTLALIVVEYASAVYISDMTALFTWTCSRCHGLTKGFEVVELIVDIENCIQAYVGVAKDPRAIVIAFRGTQGSSIQNWIEDLFWKQLDLDYPGMPDAWVHSGFYYAYHNTTVRPAILNAVKSAKEFYGDLNIIVTGHSMGGALASLCGLDLRVNYKASNVQVMTFGQPRVGNAAFASYYSKYLSNTIRVTNGNDMVPHLPPFFYIFPRETYHHFPREVWLHDKVLDGLVFHIETVCDDSGEDPTCSRSVIGDSVEDHLSYYGVEFPTGSPGTCRIVLTPSLEEYGATDLKGNIMLFRDPATPITKKTAANHGSEQNGVEFVSY